MANTGTGGATYIYDDNGNMTSRDGHTIGWSSFNYPTYLTTATETTYFDYGPDRQYFRQDYSGPSISEITHYIGGILEKVSSGGVTDWRHMITANGQTVAIVSRKSSGGTPNTVSYPLEDNQGSSSTLTDDTGALLARESFDAFGKPRDGSDWDGSVSSGDQTAIEAITRRGYTGHSMLGRMGLIHMNGRVQDAITGRFLSPDPNIPHPDFTQSYNRYAYVTNNPLSYVDPSGFEDFSNQETFNVFGHNMTVVEVQARIQQAMYAAANACANGSGSCGFYDEETGLYQNALAGYGLGLMVQQQMVDTTWGWTPGEVPGIGNRIMQAAVHGVGSVLSGAVNFVMGNDTSSQRILFAQIPPLFLSEGGVGLDPVLRPLPETITPEQLAKQMADFQKNLKPEIRQPQPLPRMPLDPKDTGLGMLNRFLQGIEDIVKFFQHLGPGSQTGPVPNTPQSTDGPVCRPPGPCTA